MPRTIVIGDLSNAIDGVLTLRGGATTTLDTIYVLDLPDGDLPPDHAVWSVSIHLHDGPGDAIVELSKGADKLYLGAGSDLAKAGCGNDLVVAGAGEDSIWGGCGTDVIHAGSGADIIMGGYGMDRIFGGPDDDVLYGGKGADVLRGGLGDDMLFGQRGDDVLHGGAGADVMVGGLGADEFHVNSLDGDRVLDFSYDQGDVLIVDGFDVSENWAVWIGPGGVVAAPPGVTEAMALVPDDGGT